jgi:hypothetical protein
MNIQTRILVTVAFIIMLVSTTSALATSVTWDFFNDVLISTANESMKQVESSIAVSGASNANLVAGFMDESAVDNFKCRAATSTDTGGSWTDRGFIPIGTDISSQDPRVVSDVNGNYFFVCLTISNLGGNTVKYWVSSDGGATWSGPTIVSSGSSNDRPAVGIKRLSDKIYVCWQNEDASGNMYIKFKRIWPTTGSELTAASGSHTPGTNGPVNMCGVSVDSAGRVYVTWARLTGTSTGSIEMRRSFNDGGSFEALTQTLKTFTRFPTSVGNCSHEWGCIRGQGTTGIRVSPNPNTAVDNNGDLHLTYATYSSVSLGNIRYAKITACITPEVSCTISAAVDVMNDGGVAKDQFMPSIYVSQKSNTIHITALDRRNSGDNTAWQPWHYHCHLASTACTSSANWFTTSITTQSSWNFDNKFFIGDYNGLVSSSTREAHAAWPDVRLWGGNQDYDVWSYRLT